MSWLKEYFLWLVIVLGLYIALKSFDRLVDATKELLDGWKRRK